MRDNLKNSSLISCLNIQEYFLYMYVIFVCGKKTVFLINMFKFILNSYELIRPTKVNTIVMSP